SPLLQTAKPWLGIPPARSCYNRWSRTDSARSRETSMRALVHRTLILIVLCLVSAGNGEASFMDDKAPKKAEPTSPLEGNHVVCRDVANQVLWSVAFEGRLDGVRPPHLIFDTQAVYVSQGDGVTALDGKTGKILWHSAGPNERMKLTKELLLATRCGYGK